MNMKKTIAAVAACAMAVSAMATTVSAVDENATEAKSVHYDLTLKSKVKTADFTFTAKSVSGGATSLVLKFSKDVVKAVQSSVTVTVADKSTKTSYTFTFTSDSGSADYDGTTSWDGENAIYTIDLEKASAASIKNAFASDSTDLDITVVMKDVPLQDGVDQTKVNIALGNILKDVDGDDELDITDLAQKNKLDEALINLKIVGIDDAADKTNAKGAVKESTIKKPMVTTANTASEGTSEIFKRLSTAGSRDVDKYYENAKAVINDMIANYDDVVFTFNTAADNVLTSAWCTANSWAGASLYPGAYVTGAPSAESWMGDSTFKAFPQHLYNLFGDESTGYTYSDSYAFNNLFNAALVANNGYTMNQSTVTPFEYSKTSVSFSWSDLTGGNSFVSPASAVNTLQLATSSEWYWDSMDVAGYVLAADDASTDAGIEDEGDDLDDAADDVDDADDDIDDTDDVDDADDTDDVADDVDDTDDVAGDDVAADDTVADETTDSNPATGNAPIALAVIPVALAAAAVVAKKRG